MSLGKGLLITFGTLFFVYICFHDILEMCPKLKRVALNARFFLCTKKNIFTFF